MAGLSEKVRKMIQFTKGCTEPAAIAFTAAHVGSYIKNAKRIHLKIDKMTFKNAYRAGIPNASDNIGVIFSVLYGYLIADPSKELEIFDGLDDAIIKKAQKMHNIVSIDIVDSEKLYIEIFAEDANAHSANVITRISHTFVSEIKVDDKIVLSKDLNSNELITFEDELYNTDNFVQLVDDLYNDPSLRTLIKEALHTNLEASMLSKQYNEQNPIFSSVFARMKGDKIRVASCAGSGNKGLVALITPFKYADSINIEDEETILKAELLSCLVTSLITSKLGFVSPLCGVVHAANVGALAAILYLQNKMELFEGAFVNYISAVSGVICDGAKKSCAMKASGGLDVVYQSIAFAEEGISMDYKDGLLGKTFLETINNLELYKSVFSMCDLKTINILKEKQAL